MGSFNSQYEDYYSSLKARRTSNKPQNFYGYGPQKKQKEPKGNIIYRRLIRDLIGVLILFVIALGCKSISTPATKAFYNYSKEALNQNYDYSKVNAVLSNIDMKGAQDRITKFLEGIRSKITGDKTYEEKVKSEFEKPVEGIVTSTYGERVDPVTKKTQLHKGVDIDVKLNTDIKACYGGKVKESGEDKDLGKYILIDHGDGIETKYGHLNEVLVKKGDAVNKGEVIAKSGNTGKSTGPHLHFEFLYMGEEENPEEYFSFKKS